MHVHVYLICYFTGLFLAKTLQIRVQKKLNAPKWSLGVIFLKNEQFLPLILIFTPLFGGSKVHTGFQRNFGVFTVND